MPKPPPQNSTAEPQRDVVDRAIGLAGSGLYQSVNHVRQTLIREGYANVGSELQGSSINRRLIALLQDARIRGPRQGQTP